jgi:hypothetical protein
MCHKCSHILHTAAQRTSVVLHGSRRASDEFTALPERECSRGGVERECGRHWQFKASQSAIRRSLRGGRTVVSRAINSPLRGPARANANTHFFSRSSSAVNSSLPRLEPCSTTEVRCAAMCRMCGHRTAVRTKRVSSALHLLNHPLLWVYCIQPDCCRIQACVCA